jgi:hypothetical protein
MNKKHGGAMRTWLGGNKIHVLEFPLHENFSRFAVHHRQTVMENLLLESRALYEMLHAELREESEARFIAYKETADTLKVFVNESATQIKSVRFTVDTTQKALHADLASVHANLGHELDTVKSSLSAEIAALSAAVDCALPSPSAPTVDLGGDDAGLLRHCVTQ